MLNLLNVVDFGWKGHHTSSNREVKTMPVSKNLIAVNTPEILKSFSENTPKQPQVKPTNLWFFMVEILTDGDQQTTETLKVVLVVREFQKS